MQKKICLCSFQQEILVEFDEKLLIYYVKKNLILILCGKNSGMGKKIYPSPPPLISEMASL